jgi:hypothetical protein
MNAHRKRRAEATGDYGPRALTPEEEDAAVRARVLATIRAARKAQLARAREVAEPDPITRQNHGATAAQIANGRVVLGINRPDPARPMRDQNGVQVGFHETQGAAAYVAYEALWSNGLLTDVEREAADRICVAAELVTGARETTGGGLRGRAFWESGGISPMAVQAASDLRAVGDVLDAATSDAVVRLVCYGQGLFYHRAKAGLAAMAVHWGME